MEQTQDGKQANPKLETPKQGQASEGGGRGGRGNPRGRGRGRGRGGSSKLRGLEKDSPDIRASKTLSWLLRHGAESEGLEMRSDGFVTVDDLLKNGRIQPLGLTLERLKAIVSDDTKQRFGLAFEKAEGTILAYTAVKGEDGEKGTWLIKANQGHSLKTVQLELKPILSVSDIPSGLAVHGTTSQAWKIIQEEGLSKMKRNHIHLAQGVGGDNVISGMRKSSQILVYVNIQKALEAGIKFHLSDNGVVLTDGNEKGYLKPEFFERVENAKTRKAIEGWEGSGPITSESLSIRPSNVPQDQS